MPYLKGEATFPPELLAEIQKYVQGSLVYIPRQAPGRLGWGRKNGAREALDRRDAAIREAAARGVSVERLADEQALSTDAIRKILYRDRAGRAGRERAGSLGEPSGLVDEDEDAAGANEVAVLGEREDPVRVIA